MSFKAEAPEEDPETKLRRELAEQRAEAGRLEELGEALSDDTRSVVRRFGRLQNPASSGSLATAVSGGVSSTNLSGLGGFSRSLARSDYNVYDGGLI